jgi:hypothetical protein
MMSVCFHRQPQALSLGVWTAATCETHESEGVWDGNVTLNAWSQEPRSQRLKQRSKGAPGQRFAVPVLFTRPPPHAAPRVRAVTD